MKTLMVALVLSLAVQVPQVRAQAASDERRVATETEARMQELTARAVAALETLDNMARRLRRQGLTLRPEVVAHRVRLESALDAAEAAIKENRDRDARRAIARGEGAAGKIEAFLQGK